VHWPKIAVKPVKAERIREDGYFMCREYQGM
jgi:hypothetical protein